MLGLGEYSSSDSEDESEPQKKRKLDGSSKEPPRKKIKSGLKALQKSKKFEVPKETIEFQEEKPIPVKRRSPSPPPAKPAVKQPIPPHKKKESIRQKNRKKQKRGQAKFTAKWDRDCPSYA